MSHKMKWVIRITQMESEQGSKLVIHIRNIKTRENNINRRTHHASPDLHILKLNKLQASENDPFGQKNKVMFLAKVWVTGNVSQLAHLSSDFTVFKYLLLFVTVF